MKKNILIGILGGMGPMAGVNLQKIIIESTRARTDQEHIRYLYLASPEIPSRQINNKYLSQLLLSLKFLKKAGATHIVMACHSANIQHSFLQKQLSVKLINLPELIIKWVRNHYSHCSIGILASPAVINSGLYEKLLKKYGYDIILPNQILQKKLNNTIFNRKIGIKAGNYNANNSKKIREIATEIKKIGAKIILLACTEIPIVYHEDKNVDLIIPEKILAEYLIKFVGKKN